MERDIVIGIVSYNPNINSLLKEINELNNKFIIVDNNSNNIEKIETKLQNYKNIKLIKNEENEGIAKALNQILNEANKLKSKYLLTLDQDSFLSKDNLNRMVSYYEDNKEITIICPIIIDLNRKKQKKYSGKIEFIKRCITSGSLMNLELCNKIGYFDEKMFIDYVDFDYCKRLEILGYKLLRVNNALLNHEIGKRTSRHFLFWKVYPTNHNANRVYFYFRNIYYYLKKHKKDINLKEKIIEYKYLIWKFLSILLYERDKYEKMKMLLKATKDYKKMF